MTSPSDGAGGAVRERPIIFTGANVLAILAGRKTQTRRPVRLPRWASTHPNDIETADAAGHDPSVICNHTGCLASLPLPWRVGDLLWVRETWADVNTDSGPALAYRAGGIHFCQEDAYPVEYERYHGCSFCMWWGDLERGEPDHRWRSPIHMPRWASRLTLAVTDVRVQRLQDISCADAIAEGIPPAANSATIDCDTPDPRHAYRDLWNSIHSPSAWDANPWVAAITFEVASRPSPQPSTGPADAGVRS